MLSRLVRGQLLAFLLVSLLGVGLLAVYYAQLPRLLGIGAYPVSVALPRASGLYPHANVTYRGVQVGTVERLDLTGRGVVARLSIDDGTRIPADSRAEVHSISAIGEQYLDFVPQGSGGADLAPGDVVPRRRTTVPVGTASLLTSVNALLQSLPRDDLATTVDELYRAFNGSGDDLGLLLDSATTLQDAAGDNLAPTLALIRQLVPVLGTQRDVSGELRSSTGDLASFTQQLVDSDADLRGVLRTGPALGAQARGLFADLDGPLPVLLADLATTGRVLRAYLPGLEHTLIVLPALTDAGQSVVPPEPGGGYGPAKLNVEVSSNTPPYCTQGFEDADRQRAPSDTSPAPAPTDSYCKVAPDDPRVVRGARNLPCPNDPAERAATAAGCGLVFDRVGVPGGRRPAPWTPDRTARYDPGTGRVVTPDGRFFRLADLIPGRPDPQTWQQLLDAPLRLGAG